MPASGDHEEKRPRGFAAMSSERRSEIASMGGREAQRLGKAYKFTPHKAREAGRKGGLA
jgi:general stress protein YciG